MSIVVKPINQIYKVKFKTEDEEVIAHIRQLNYATRCLIMGESWRSEAGVRTFDTGKSCFLNLKYGLVKIEGLTNEDGTPYKLEKDVVDDCLSDECVDALLSTELENELIYTAAAMGARIPKEIRDLNTGEILQGVEVITSKGGTEKK